MLKADVSIKSVDWLETRVNEVIRKIDELDQKEARLFKSFPNKRQALMQELDNLINRAKVEKKTLDTLESTIIKFIEDFQNEKEIEKKKIKRKKK